MKPKIIIVDENDQQIGVKERSKMDYSVDIYRSTSLWLTNSNGEVLIAKRSLDKDKDPGVWGPAAAGTVDEGETYDSNVYKEAEEEIGLTGVQFEKASKAFYEGNRRQYCQWFTASIDWPLDKFKLQVEEVAELAWVDSQVLKEDVTNNPKNYIPMMPRIVEAFVDSVRQSA